MFDEKEKIEKEKLKNNFKLISNDQARYLLIYF